jgi:branched-chain amino acid transport system substrate-binding protein
MNSFHPRNRVHSHATVAAVAAVATGLLVTVAACSSSGSSGSSGANTSNASNASSDSTIHIGTVLPLSGAAASTAAQYLGGMEAAIDAANAAGGVNGHRIVLDKVDDGFEVPRTIAGIKQLAEQDHDVAILGPYGTNAAVAAVPIAQEVQTPIVGPLAYAIGLYKPVSQYVFPLFPSQEAIYQALTEYAITKLGATRVAIMGNDGEVGNETITGAEAALTAHGLKPVTVIREDNDAASYSGTLAQIKSANADAVVVQSDSTSMATMLENAKDAGLTAPFLGGVSSGDASFAKLTGTVGDGTYGVVNINLTGGAPGWSTYTAAVAKYTSTTSTSSFAASGYAAAQVVLGALAKVSGTATASSVTAALVGNTFSTLGGPVTFTATDHLGLKPMYLTVVKNGAVTLTGVTLTAS